MNPPLFVIIHVGPLREQAIFIMTGGSHRTTPHVFIDTLETKPTAQRVLYYR